MNSFHMSLKVARDRVFQRSDGGRSGLSVVENAELGVKELISCADGDSEFDPVSRRCSRGKSDVE